MKIIFNATRGKSIRRGLSSSLCPVSNNRARGLYNSSSKTVEKESKNSFKGLLELLNNGRSLLLSKLVK